jgi:hypothetical protein
MEEITPEYVNLLMAPTEHFLCELHLGWNGGGIVFFGGWEDVGIRAVSLHNRNPGSEYGSIHFPGSFEVDYSPFLGLL